MKSAVKILLVDDHVIVRSGITFLLQSQDVFVPLITEVANGAEAIDKIYKDEYDIILMDVRMPKMNGIVTVKKLRQKGNNIPVLTLSVSDEESIIKQVMNAGSNGYILKDTGVEELVKAIETVLEGGKYFSNKVAQVILGDSKKESSSIGLEKQLTRREWQILKMIGEELNHDEIAQKLNISRRTVEGHKKNLTAKLNVKGSVGLTKIALRNGIVK